MKYRGIIINLLVALIFAIPCFATVVSSAVVPSTRASSFTVTNTIWNSDVGGVYSYINNNIVPALNKLTTKGDMYVYDGSALQRLAAGTDGQVLTAASGDSKGVAFASFANATQLTTKGDILTYASGATRLGVGTNGTVLTARSSATEGIAWESSASAIPTGTIIAWSPAAAATNTIPTGWFLCDGTNSTPNLIGRFIIGTRPGGSAAAPAADGYGAQTVDANGSGSVNHTHTIPATTGSTTGPNNLVGIVGGSGGVVATDGHTHTVNIPGGTSGATTSEPADYALVYIMKQ